MTMKEEIDLFEKDNKSPESVCPGQRWNVVRKTYDVCVKKDDCDKYNKFINCNILDNYHNLKFVKHHYLPSFKNCTLNELTDI